MSVTPSAESADVIRRKAARLVPVETKPVFEQRPSIDHSVSMPIAKARRAIACVNREATGKVRAIVSTTARLFDL